MSGYDASQWRTIELDEVETLHAEIESIVTGWYIDQNIDTHDFLDRLEGLHLSDGKRLDLGGSLDDPVIKSIMRYARKFKREITS